MLSPDTRTRIEQMSLEAFEGLWARLDSDDARVAALYERCRTDLALFARTFFPERFDLHWSPVQAHFFKTRLPGWRLRTRQHRRRWVSPRGSAKSSVKSFLEPLHDILYGNEVCIHVYSTGYRLAELLVKDIHAVLADPPSLMRRVFGAIRITGTQTNFVAMVPGAESLGTAVVAMSFGGDARGYKHAGKRPSKFILDDTVNPKHIKNPERRDDQWKFLQRDIGRAGWSYSVYELVGTIQHPDDLVARVVNAPDWTGQIWKNLIAWPTRMDLWEECKKLWANLDDPDRLDTARAFYEERREAMDAGAVVLWPEGRPLFDLMQTFWASPGAFWTEDQNDPKEAGDAIFPIDKVRRCTWDREWIYTSRGTRVAMSRCQIAIWLDPSGGKKGADLPAIAVVARDPQGWRYVLAVEAIARPPSEQQAALWRWWERFAHLHPLVGTDETGTQGLLGEAFERQREERRRQQRPWTMPVQTYSLSEEKIQRIARLEPEFKNGFLEICADLPGVAIEQLRDFPHATHDDIPDAIERADWLLFRDVSISATVRGS